MELRILGSGTSHGVPVIGCNCSVCRSKNKKDSRLRCSALITASNKNYLIDVGPDFRQQALKASINSLEAVFLTHSHADHIHGIDDLRIFSHKNSRAMNENLKIKEKFPETKGQGLPIYTSSRTIEHVMSSFQYIFVDHDKGGGVPKLNFIPADGFSTENPINLEEISVVPVPLQHGNRHTFGWVFSTVNNDGKTHSLAYLTDCSFICDKSLKTVKSFNEDGVLDVLVIDALREKTHSSHNSFRQALEYADIIQAKHTYFTHITHDFKHREIQKYINRELKTKGKYENLKRIIKNGGSVSPAFDMLKITV